MNSQTHKKEEISDLISEEMNEYLSKSPEEPKSQEKCQSNKDKKINLRWTIEENLKYLQILGEFRGILEGEECGRRSVKVFIQMEKKIGIQKTSEQIRGHHKKMKKKYESFNRILTELPKDLKRKEKAKKMEKKQKQFSTLPQNALMDDWNQFWAECLNLDA